MTRIFNKKRYYIKRFENNRFRELWWISVIIISIGGLFYPLLGLFVPLFMISLLIISYFKGRYWCGNLCPRGSFNDYVVKRYSLNKKTPNFIRSNFFRYSVLSIFIILFSLRTYIAFSDFIGYTLLLKMGYIFATLCLVTTLIAIVLGGIYSPRSWCMFCPMGTMQKEIYRLKKKNE